MGPVSAYSASYILGIVLVHIALTRASTVRRTGLSPERELQLLATFVIAFFVGARLFHVLANVATSVANGTALWKFYAAQPFETLNISRGGMSAHGGIIAAYFACRAFCKRAGLNPLAVADEIVPALPLPAALARLAMLARPESSLGAAAIPGVHWEMVEAVLLLTVALPVTLIVRARATTPGLVFWAFVAAYSVCRLVAELFRPEMKLAAMTVPQLVSVTFLVLAAVRLRALASHPSAPHSAGKPHAA